MFENNVNQPKVIGTLTISNKNERTSFSSSLFMITFWGPFSTYLSSAEKSALDSPTIFFTKIFGPFLALSEIFQAKGSKEVKYKL
jgi:hypothetical protein